MDWFKSTLTIVTRGKGLFEFSGRVNDQIQEWDIQEGMCFLFMPHTSASLIINESYDPSARRDLETFMEKLVPEGKS